MLRATRIAVALLTCFASPVRAADAVEAYGAFYLRNAVMLKCHPANDAALAGNHAEGESLRRAALEEFWSEIDAVNPTHHKENRIRAEEMLQQERAARDADDEARIKTGGCENLEPPGARA